MCNAARRYRNLVVRAVSFNDKALIDLIAEHLAACERAAQMLRAKGYCETASSGVAIDVMASLVPENR